MKHLLLILLFTAGLAANTFAQSSARAAQAAAERPAERGGERSGERPPQASAERAERPSPSRVLNFDSYTTTQAEVTIKGVRVPYTATAGTIPVWDEDGKPIAGVFYTYYERS